MTVDTQSPGLIPDQLLSDIKRGDCVLFLGADLPLSYEGAPSSRPELAAALADKYGLPPESSWPEAAQAYLGRFAGDRHGLVSFVAAHCSGPRVRPGPLHEAIARAGFRAVVTAWYDDLLEMALRDAGYRVNRVVRDTQLPYAQEGEREAIVVKLYGCLSDPESLVLGTWDHEVLMDRLSRKLELVTAFCALRPPLFVGFDPTDRVPMRLYVRASTNMVAHMRRAYAVWSDPLDTVRAAWQGKNVEFRRADAAAFLRALAAQMPPARPGVQGAVRVHRPPYKFLDYYEPGDADIFCGRDTESQVVARLALSHRLLTLFGPSGAGKTSLLLAGVLPRLDAEGYRHVYVRALDDPLPAVRKEIAARAGRADWESGADLRAFLEEMLAPDDKLVVVLDQFEELFLRVGTSRRASFFRQLAAALDPPEREVRFIFSLREDYLARLDEARADLPDVFANSFRLAALDRPNARVAITEPAARASVVVEPSLVDALVGGEGREAGDLVEAGGHVPPAALQIVLDRLYREALPPGFRPDDPPPPGLTLSLAAYRAVRHRLGEGEEAEELAGAQAILAGYVAEGLVHLPDLKREDGQTELGADPELGRAILKVMITSQATKAALTQAEILAWLDEAGVVRAGDAADEALVKNTRLGLERVRLLRGFERNGVPLYELAHDHLAAEIATWISEEEIQARLARELLRREMDNWRDAGLLMRPEVLALIHDRREELKRLSADELELLFRSALAAEHEVSTWRDRAPAVVGKVERELFDGLGSDDADLAQRAVSGLVALASPAIVGRLAEVVEADFTATGRVWVDHRGQRQEVRRTALNLTTFHQRRAVLALARMALPDATEALGRWTPPGMVLIPAGPFAMGGTGISDEGPVHEVWLDAFWIDRYPVTNAQWAAFLEGGGWGRRELWTEAGWRWREGKSPEAGRWDERKRKRDHPVREISWYESLAYARWAGKALLSEAQWEKAASWEEGDGETGGPGEQGKKREYPWGDEFEESRCNTVESAIGDTSTVGQYSPRGDSPYGVADMAGNVWEWCCNLYVPYPYNAADGREVLEGTGDRVVRGGSFDLQGVPRSAARHGGDPSYRYRNYGVRVGVAAAHFSPASGL